MVEVIESTVKNKPVFRRFSKIKLPIPFSCTPSMSDLVEYETERNEINSKMMMLENERAIEACIILRRKVRAAIVVEQRFCSMVYWVPAEIWSRIFWLCLPEEEEECLDPTQCEAPLLLCRVCYTWRNIAIHTPELWNSLVLRLQGQSGRRPFVQTWISRSGSLPLSLHVLWGPTNSLQIHDDVFDYLLSLAHRWQSLRLSVAKNLVWQSHGFPTRAHKLLSYHMPLLRTLQLEPSIAFGITNLERNAPQLRELWLMNNVINPLLLMVSNWDQLSTLRSKYLLDVSHASRIFRLCPNLVDCEIAVISCSFAQGTRRTFMPHLESLTIHETSTRVLEELFRHLRLPSLRDMTLNAFSALDDKDPWSAESILTMLHGSVVSEDEVKLSALRMRDINCDEKTIRDLVFGIPSLFWFDVQYRGRVLFGHAWIKLLRGMTNGH